SPAAWPSTVHTSSRRPSSTFSARPAPADRPRSPRPLESGGGNPAECLEEQEPRIGPPSCPLLNLLDCADRQQRMTAELEEIIARADAIDAEHQPPDVGDRHLRRR